MSYSDMSGLELFTTPFCRTQTPRTAQASSQQTSQPRPKAAATPAQQPKTQAPAAQPKPPVAQAQQSGIPEETEPKAKAPVPQAEAATKPEPVQGQKPHAATPDSAKEQIPVDTQTKPEPPTKELVMDISADADPSEESLDEAEQARRKAHEEAEAKRKAEWEARQIAKKQSEEAAIQALQAMSDEEAVAASTERVRVEVERLTRRNMKECVSEHIQELCRKNPAFARLTMNPRKNMINCFRYINRMAKEYIKKEMEENDIQPNGGCYGSDVPDDLCYQWGVDYFNDIDAPEDKEKEEKFIPKPYVGGASKKKKTSKPKKTVKTAKKETQKKTEPSEGYEQMSLTGVTE